MKHLTNTVKYAILVNGLMKLWTNVYPDENGFKEVQALIVHSQLQQKGASP